MPGPSSSADRARRRALVAISVVALSLVAIGLYALRSTNSEPGDPTAPVADEPIGAPGEPYPYTTPVPPRTPTVVDGTYERRLSVEGRPVPCRRCAPYRMEAGAATLVLDRGWFTVEHPSADFRSVGHFLVEGNRLLFFNDPNCPAERGVYEWSLDGAELLLNPVRDECPFDRLRGRYLTAEPWTRA